jgi:hypothetical protein
MLTEMRRTSVPTVEHSRMPEISPPCISPPSISPIVISATLCFVLLHFVIGIMLGGSHVHSSIEPAALVAPDNGLKCLAETSALEPSPPNVWSPGSD